MADINQILAAIGQSGAIASNRPKLYVTPTRLPGFNNEVMKTGGLVGGRIYELYAPNSAGKSTLKSIFYADYQRAGKIAADIDSEASTQTETEIEEKQSWLATLGVNTENLIMPNFSSAEDCFDVIKRLIVAGVNIIGIDTIAVLQPESLAYRAEETANMREKLDLATILKYELDGIVGGFALKKHDASNKIDKSRVGWKERNYIPISNEVLQRLANCGVTIRDIYFHKLWYYDCAIVAVNHAKDMIGVLYGDPTYTPGGKSLGFHSSVRIGMTKPVSSKEKIKVGMTEVPAFRQTRVVAAKNKLAAPFGEMTLRVYQTGMVQEDIPFSVLAEQKGLVQTTGRSVTILVGQYAGTVMRKTDFEQWVAENPAFLEMVDESLQTLPDATEEAPTPEIQVKKLTLSFPKKEEIQEQSAKLALKVGLKLTPKVVD